MLICVVEYLKYGNWLEIARNLFQFRSVLALKWAAPQISETIWWVIFTWLRESWDVLKNAKKEVCMDGQVVRCPWGLASHLVSGNVGEIGEGLKENKVLRSFGKLWAKIGSSDGHRKRLDLNWKENYFINLQGTALFLCLGALDSLGESVSPWLLPGFVLGCQ